MSSSFVVEPQEGSSKKDDTLILMVNDNGVISVDQDTLQSLILNQSNAAVSVVRLGQTGNDASEGNITLTVDPPSFVTSGTSVSNNPDSTALVDPFMEMDPESLERLETALQSEEAKQILGENVTAMLDMLTVEEQQNNLRYSIELDHCYTSRSSLTQSKATESLPDINLSDVDESACVDVNKSTNASQMISLSSSNNNVTTVLAKQKVTPTPPKIVKQPGPVGGRPRRSSDAIQQVVSPKTSMNTNTRMLNMQQEKLNTKDEEVGGGDEIFSSTDSSASEETDSDSDFGPRSSRRGVRSRGGRKGLTTRGGSMTASRRRGSNKYMDSEQVRRLDIEMAAAVSAMKSREKEDKSEKHSPGRIKKLSKTFGVKKKEVSPTVTSVNEPSHIEINVLQTTNQVKANLINANMFKGDMILTKPGQDRNNQKVVFVHKQIAMNPNEIKALGLKKQVMIPKSKLITSQSSKVPIIKDIQIISAGNPAIIKNALVQQQPMIVHQNVTTQAADQPNETAQRSVQSQKGIPMVLKAKPPEIKKEKKKIDGISEIPAETVNETLKSVETKTSTAPKKIVKKEHRKSDTHVVEALGPALFSTPDIIRRVGSTEIKASDSPVAHLTVASVSNTNVNASIVNTVTSVSTTLSTTNTTLVSTTAGNILDGSIETNIITNNASNTTLSNKLDDHSLLIPDNLVDDKIDDKTTIADLLQPALDSAGIEGDDHLLATLGMDPAKQLPNDEELLAEALLSTLGVDLDQSGLVDPTADLPEPILSSSVIEPSQPLSVEPTTIKTDFPQTAVLREVTASSISRTEPVQKKDTKEPIQIIRGGRVITLPPIEAPATRSKRLQTRAENQVKVEKKSHFEHQFSKTESAVTPVKSERTPRTSTHVSFHKQDMIYNMDDEEEEEEEEEEEPNSDSEDDPNRLWCICRQPHNNRFMICCDMCQDWFHGKCVHVTKAMGEQMESQGIEWVCPNCSKKKSEESKPKLGSRRQRNSVDAALGEKNRTPTISNVSNKPEIKATHNTGKNPSTSSGVTHCVVCKKEARKSSIYCSDACILAHAETTSTKPASSSQVKTPKVDGAKLKSDARIVVFDKRTGKVITGADAPTASNLRAWLKEHPTCEVVKPNNLNTIQLSGKTVAAIQTQGIKINKPVQGKSVGQAKMIYTKMPGSKQTVLAASIKKNTSTSDAPLSSAASPQQRQKQVPVKLLKQTTIKTLPQTQQQPQPPQQQPIQQPTPQKPIATSTPLKPTVSRKSQEVVKSATPQQKQQQTPPPKKPEAEQLRLTVRKTLADVLIARIKEAKDLNLSEEEIIEVALQIELEMYKFFKDTGSKYKAKYRSLVFNVKDPKNLTLFRKIADHSLTAEAVVKLSPEEMASQELAEWREKETKHQLEMIKKNELDMMAQAKSIVVKTHKGEQIIENDGGIESIDLKTPVQDIVTALNSGDTTPEDNNKLREDEATFSKFLDGDDKKKKKKEKDRDREKRRDRSRDQDSKDGSKRDRSRSKSRHRHRERSRDRKSKKEKHKGRDRTRDKDHDKSRHRDKKKDKDDDRKDKHKRSRSSSRSHSKTRYKDHKDKHKQKEEEKKKEASAKGESSVVNVDKSIEERLWRHIEDETTTNTLDGNDSDISDREPSSTVTIKTPDINEELDKDFDLNLMEVQSNETITKGVMTVWRGIVHMADVAKFSVTAQNVSGNSKELMEELPGTLDVVGRISPTTVWDYIAKMRKHPNKEIVIIKLTATNDEEKIPYITLYSYLNSRSRLGVVGSMSSPIKDFYIMPFSHNSMLPSVLMPIDGPGFEENRQTLLLGIMVVHSRTKRLASVPPPLTPIPTKIIRKEQITGDRSYTPPPPLHLLPGSVKDDDQDSKQSLSVISKIVPELSSKITLESSSSSDKMHLNDDDDEPYSPGEPVDLPLDDDDEDALSSSSSIKMTQITTETSISFTTVVAVSPSKSSTELQRKMEELSRQIEEEKMQIQNISSSFLGDSSTTLPGLGLDPPDSNDAGEAYSPSDTRSFTPPPQGIPKLSQPILEKVSNITIPPNLQEILANVKRQESSKVDPYLPSKPGATFLTSNNSSSYSPTYNRTTTGKSSSDVQSSPRKETKSTLSSLSDYDLMKKAEEELAALAAADAASAPLPMAEPVSSEPPPPGTSFESPHR
ncbi:death-inducer obliterator 1 isoform X2 [Phymastichus coffea]|uniref:death-inducer obliterator 1 isoform X2 n=1 Tax=Phymastichus coffea TaxID=108790 RepID=UPI00273C03F5|nr:death-inducer obliterator 1 isoform X2 [Phymastichus coffea]